MLHQAVKASSSSLRRKFPGIKYSLIHTVDTVNGIPFSWCFTILYADYNRRNHHRSKKKKMRQVRMNRPYDVHGRTSTIIWTVNISISNDDKEKKNQFSFVRVSVSTDKSVNNTHIWAEWRKIGDGDCWACWARYFPTEYLYNMILCRRSTAHVNVQKIVATYKKKRIFTRQKVAHVNTLPKYLDVVMC